MTKGKIAVLYKDAGGSSRVRNIVESTSGTSTDINALIATLSASGGGVLRLGSGVWDVTSRIIGADDVRLEGSGPTTMLRRVGSMAVNTGMIDATNVSRFQLASLTVDAATTTAVQILRSTIGGDPMHASLVANSSVWAHEGCVDLLIEDVIFTHAAGYSILLDARDGNVENTVIRYCSFLNNRAHSFGATAGDKKYGSWTSGIHYQNDGRTSAGKLSRMIGLRVEDCRFEKHLGIGAWGHGYGFDSVNKGFDMIDCRFKFNGLDCVEAGNVTDGSVRGMRGDSIGYIPSDPTSDDSAWVPGWDPSGPGAVFVDSTGYVRNFKYTDNEVVQINGEVIDGDGLFDSSIEINRGSVDLTLAEVASYGPGGTGNVSRGIVIGNTYYPQAASKLNIVANVFDGLLGGNVFCNLKDSLVKANSVHQQSASAVDFAPMTLLCAGTNDSDHHARGNTFVGNAIVFDGAYACINEIEPGWANAFSGTDVNTAAGNFVFGTNAGEFSKSPTSGSTNRMSMSVLEKRFAVISSDDYSDAAANAYDSSKMLLRRNPSSGAAEVSSVNTGGARVWSGIATSTPPGSSTSVIFNDAGSYGGGSNFTWNKTDQKVTVIGKAGAPAIAVTTHGYVASIEGFQSDGTSYATFNAPAGGANLNQLTLQARTAPTPAVGLGVIYYDSVANATLLSNNNGSYAKIIAATAMTWDEAAKKLAITGVTATAALSVDLGYTFSKEGFSTDYANYNAFQATGAHGGFLGAQLTLNAVNTSLISGGAGVCALCYDSMAHVLKYNAENAGWVTIGAGSQWTTSGSDIYYSAGNVGIGGAPTLGVFHVKSGAHNLAFTSAGDFALGSYFSWTESPPTLQVTGNVQIAGATGAVNVLARDGVGAAWAFYNPDGSFRLYRGADRFILAADGPVTIAGKASVAGLTVSAGWISSSEGFNTLVSNYAAINAPNGGAVINQLSMGERTAPTAGAGYAVLYASSSTHKLYLSLNNGAFNEILTAGSAVTGVKPYGGTAYAGEITLQGGIGMSVTQSTSTMIVGLTTTSGAIYWDDTYKTLKINAYSSSYPGLSVDTGYVYSAVGFSTAGTAYNSIQSSGGVVAGNGTYGGFYVSTTQVINSSGQLISAVNTPSSGVVCAGVNPYVGGLQYYCVSSEDWYFASGFTAGGTTKYNVRIRGGIVCYTW